VRLYRCQVSALINCVTKVATHSPLVGACHRMAARAEDKCRYLAEKLTTLFDLTSPHISFNLPSPLDPPSGSSSMRIIYCLSQVESLRLGLEKVCGWLPFLDAEQSHRYARTTRKLRS